MAINIFSGSNGSGRGSSTRSSKAKPKTKTRVAPAVQTESGNKLIKGQLGSTIGKIGGIAAKYGNLIPGIGGIVSTVGKVAESLNDPWWWMNVPGTGVSTNIPLQTQVDACQVRGIDQLGYNGTPGALTSSKTMSTYPVANLRPGMLEFISSYVTGSNELSVINPTIDQISTYLMQEVRAVVNAVPLQIPEAYGDCIMNGAMAYALKHNLDKYIYMTRSAKPFMPALTDGSFPILEASSYATLVGMRDRLAEYISASVRLPHTLCCYLAWRYGRVYRTGDSEKAGVVLYNILPMDTVVADYSNLVNSILGFVADTTRSYMGATYTTSAKASALADLYNAYRDHVLDVPVLEDTQFTYDRKEFVLRTNLDIVNTVTEYGPVEKDLVYMDSSLDNKTTFMASTVSTRVGSPLPLFPVSAVTAWDAGHPAAIAHLSDVMLDPSDLVKVTIPGTPSTTGWDPTSLIESTSGAWKAIRLTPLINFVAGASGFHTKVASTAADIMNAAKVLLVNQAVCVAAAMCKALEFYNVELFLEPYFVYAFSRTNSDSTDDIQYAACQFYVDLTAPSTDLAVVANNMLANNQTYAFANLVNNKIRSYTAAERKVAVPEIENAAAQAVNSLTSSDTKVILP